MATGLRRRLLLDIAEIQNNPYPDIVLHIQDDNLSEACLVLTPDGFGSMHLTIELDDDYPLRAPRVRMDSQVSHPNVFDDYICASILNTTAGWTPAYTLKGVAIQLLSFFASDKIEQEYGGSVSLNKYRDTQSYIHGSSYSCTKCLYGSTNYGLGRSLGRPTSLSVGSVPSISGEGSESNWPSLGESSSVTGRSAKRRKSGNSGQAQVNTISTSEIAKAERQVVRWVKPEGFVKKQLPAEVLLMICENLEAEDLFSFAQAYEEVGRVITAFDVIRTRELRCFCMKKDYLEAKLGVGVDIGNAGKIKQISSEFDLLSDEGFYEHGVWKSVQGITFQKWLPLPISYGHWRKVQLDAQVALREIQELAGIPGRNVFKVVYCFMSDIIVKLNQKHDENPECNARSTLTHASEKAIESYFHLFHLLLCLATEDPTIIAEADTLLKSFADGRVSKNDCDNLGHLLVASLISSVPMNEQMLKTIIKEAATRNVVWMFSQKLGHGNMPGLSYIEPSEVSEFRLRESFKASKTSYRFFMFLNVFRTTALNANQLPKPPQDKKWTHLETLQILRDQAFDRHGAPPYGEAKNLANKIKRIQQVNDFPTFLRVMGISVDRLDKAWFTTFLKNCIQSSMDKGYTSSPLNQGQALYLRQQVEPDVEIVPGLFSLPFHRTVSFFPQSNGTDGVGGRRGGYRGGMGNYYGRGRGGGGRGRGGRGGYHP